jgi:hypothetical protein
MLDKKLSDKILAEKFLENEGEMNSFFEETLSKLEMALQILISDLEYCKEKKFEILTYLYNSIIHINLLLIDNKTTAKNLANAKTKLQKLYYIRIFYTIAYEALEDIPQITGKEFRTILQGLPNGNIYILELNTLSKGLFDFKNNNNDLFKNVRNLTFAHRDHDSELQVSSILGLNWGDAIDLMLSFDPILRSYGQFMESILSDVTNRADLRNEFLYIYTRYELDCE